MSMVNLLDIYACRILGAPEVARSRLTFINVCKFHRATNARQMHIQEETFEAPTKGPGVRQTETNIQASTSESVCQPSRSIFSRFGRNERFMMSIYGIQPGCVA